MYLINFGHPVTPTQLAQIGELLAKSEPAAGLKVGRVINVPVQVDLYDSEDNALASQAEFFVRECNLTPTEWQTVPLLISLPGLAPIAACLLAELEGRIGHLPSICVMRPVAGTPVTLYEVSAILNLQDIRSEARKRRQPINQE